MDDTDFPSYISLQSQSRNNWYWDTAILSQALAGATAGKVYFVSVQVNLPGLVDLGACVIYLSAGDEMLLEYDYEMSAQYGAVNASGILDSTPSSLDLTVECTSYVGRPFDIWASFDNVQLFVYDPSAGYIPPSPGPSERLVNNNFDGADFSPWTTSGDMGDEDFAVIEGRATITYSRPDIKFGSQARISQVLQKPFEAGQRVRIQADVYFNNPRAGTTCFAQIKAGDDVAWYTEAVGSSETEQHYPVDELQTLTQGSTALTLVSYCTGTGSTASISFDNVYLTLES
jgi:hypothetical protein